MHMYMQNCECVHAWSIHKDELIQSSIGVYTYECESALSVHGLEPSGDSAVTDLQIEFHLPFKGTPNIFSEMGNPAFHDTFRDVGLLSTFVCHEPVRAYLGSQ